MPPHEYTIGERVAALDEKGRVLFFGTVQYVRPDGAVNVMRDHTGSEQTVEFPRLKLIRKVPELDA